LVQHHDHLVDSTSTSTSTTGNSGEYVMVHGLCLDHMVEEGVGPLSWQQSVQFVEELLAPAAQPPHLLALAWQVGDVCVFDNRVLQHSVTPTHSHNGDPGYAALGERRLMTRTAMQPVGWTPSPRGVAG